MKNCTILKKDDAIFGKLLEESGNARRTQSKKRIEHLT